MFHKLLFAFFLFTVITIAGEAQKVTPVFRHLTATDGLPSSTIYFVMQDSKGYMWFTTDHGVARYNSYEFKVFTTKDGLGDNTVFNLFEDARGRIWMFTFSGKLFYYLDGKIFTYKYNKAVTDFVQGTAPSEIYVDTLDNVYLTCHGKGEILITNSGKTIREFKFDDKEYNTVLIHEFSDTCLLSSFSGSVEGSSQSPSPLKILFAANSRVDTIFPPVTKYSLWVSSVRLNKNELIFSFNANIYLYKKDSVFLLDSLPVTDIYFLRKGKRGTINACTDKGLYVFDNISTKKESEVYFANSAVTGYCEDSENGFWITTRDSGVFYSPDFAVKNLEVQDQKFTRPTCLISDFKNTIYAGYWGGSVAQINGSKQTALYSSSLSKHVYNLYLDEQNSLLISGNHSGIIFENSFRPIINDFVSPNFAHNLKTNFVEHDSFLYGAAQSNLYKIKKDRVIEYAILNQRINCLFETNQKQLLLGSKNGVFRFIDSAKNIIPFNIALEDISIEDIKQFHNQMCFATQGKGLFFFDGTNNISISESNGLVSDLINRIFIHDNDIWCATNKGISRIHFNNVNKFNYNITNISTKEGLPTDEINDITFLNDTIWVATNSGVCFFDFKHNFTNNMAPIVYITGMHINGIDSSIRSNYSLPHYFNNLKISFEGISFKSQTDITYRYVLKTESDSITGYTKSRDVDFLSLSAGRYTFYVQAKNSSDVWSKNGAMLSFTINPAWWNTWWFRIAIVVLISVLIFVLYKTRIKRLKQLYDAERKQADWQLIALRSQMNPHFIFNVMNSIRTYMQMNDMQSAQKYLVKFSKLIRHTLESSGMQEISLSEELIALQNYAELEQQRFQIPFQFQITIEEIIDAEKIKVPSMILQPIVENAIKHGIANLNYTGIISVQILKTEKIICRITDNGVGRKESGEMKNESNEKHLSKGVSMIADRIDAYNKAYNRKMSFYTDDTRDESGNCIGTIVEITF